ncbi:MAG: transketolase [Ignavibacteria bacterium]|nr:transketolase [Ignavibacteria bacterium]
MTKSDTLCINTIRLLSADAVQKANSGHPGMPMGAAAMAFTLWTKYLKFDPSAPDWTARDRFVLSTGHGRMLLDSLLHLTGYDLSLDDIQDFPQLDSKTPGHPEYHLTPDVATITGPLGQGFANGVGFAIAQKYLSAVYDRPDYEIFNYNIYGIVSDGDLMEGISSEAASLAGHLKLGNIIYLYDDNQISIEGDTEITFTEDTSKRFEAFGWQVIEVSDGNDVDKISQAIESAKEEKSKPTLIKVRTEIAFGSPNKINTAGAHGSPLGADELRLTKTALGFDPDKDFFIPEEALKVFKDAGDKGKKEKKEWDKLFAGYSAEYPKEAEEINSLLKGNFKEGWEKSFPVFSPDDGAVATRSASGKTLNAIAEYFPQLIGGSADLEPSNDTFLKKYKSFQTGSYNGRNFHFGVREHAMGAILNGITLTIPLIAYGGTFLIFSEYIRAPIRLAAIMGIRPVYVFTHDSIALGEDGTTHQPIEQLISLRSIPDNTVIRPSDANETSEAWKTALSIKSGPVALILTRQKLPVLDRNKYASADNLSKGAYILSESKGKADKSDIIIIATGSEVHLALEVQSDLLKENISARVVSMPSWELFEKQSDDYKESVLPSDIRNRVSIEAGSSLGWHKYVTDEGMIIGIDKFGKSAPGDIIMKDYGFDKDLIKTKIKNHFKL